MNREAGHITDFEQIGGAPHALAIAALPANMVVPCSQIASEQTIMRREQFWLPTGSTSAAPDWDGGGKSCCFSTRFAQRHVSECGWPPLAISSQTAHIPGQPAHCCSLPVLPWQDKPQQPTDEHAQASGSGLQVSLGTCPTISRGRSSQGTPSQLHEAPRSQVS